MRGRCSERLAGAKPICPCSRRSTACCTVVGLGALAHQDRRADLVRAGRARGIQPGVRGARARGAPAVSQERMKRSSARCSSRRRGCALRPVPRRPALGGRLDDRRAELPGRPLRPDAAAVLATCRPADMTLAQHPFLAIRDELRAHGALEKIRSAFSSAATSSATSRDVSAAPVPASLAEMIHAKTDGSPLFMADVVRYLRDSGSLVERDGEWLLARSEADAFRELPASIRSMIAEEDRAARRSGSEASSSRRACRDTSSTPPSSPKRSRWIRPKSRNGSTRSSTCTCSSSAPGSTSSGPDAVAPVSVRPRALPERAVRHAPADAPCALSGRVARALVAHHPVSMPRSQAGSPRSSNRRGISGGRGCFLAGARHAVGLFAFREALASPSAGSRCCAACRRAPSGCSTSWGSR